jgi:glycosyltransferase involved in cell wall biosynthesis
MPGILVDLYKTRNVNSGIGRFALNFAETLAKKTIPGYAFDFLCPNNFPDRDWGSARLLQANFQKRYLPWLNESYDIWHSLDQFPSYFPSRHSKWILTIHDLNFLVEKDRQKSNRYLRKLQGYIDRATAISVISDFTRNQVLENLNVQHKPVYRIYNGISVPSYPAAQKPGFLTGEKFFFSIGIISAKKNFHVLVPLLKKFPGHHLVIAGENSSPYAKNILIQADELQLTGRVHLPGKISDEEKFWLYSNCRAFFFPSLAEGFGMPVIEAMLLGKPVFTSTFASLPEIGGKHAFYWMNFDPDHMAEVVTNGLAMVDSDKENFSAAMTAHAQKFNWESCMAGYLEMYRETARGDNP